MSADTTYYYNIQPRSSVHDYDPDFLRRREGGKDILGRDKLLHAGPDNSVPMNYPRQGVFKTRRGGTPLPT